MTHTRELGSISYSEFPNTRMGQQQRGSVKPGADGKYKENLVVLHEHHPTRDVNFRLSTLGSPAERPNRRPTHIGY